VLAQDFADQAVFFDRLQFLILLFFFSMVRHSSSVPVACSL
jgi:hypothetical protein